MWDIGGQETLRAAWHTYYINTDVMRHYGKRFHCLRFFLLWFSF